MLITDRGEIIRLKLIYGGEVKGQFISFANFILSSPHYVDPFVLPCTPTIGAKYLTALVEVNEYKLIIVYLEMDGKPYSINRFGDIPYYGSTKTTIKNEWKRMIVGKYYVDNR